MKAGDKRGADDMSVKRALNASSCQLDVISSNSSTRLATVLMHEYNVYEIFTPHSMLLVFSTMQRAQRNWWNIGANEEPSLGTTCRLDACTKDKRRCCANLGNNWFLSHNEALGAIKIVRSLY